VSNPAQDRMQRGPLAALLILLGLFLGSGPAAATTSGFAAPAARAERQGAAAAYLGSASRSTLDDEKVGAGPLVLPSHPRLVTDRLWTRQGAGFPVPAADQPPRPSLLLYRARAPPAA
jgi:hypothetical protein